MRPTEITLKRLFARTGNQCAFPHCVATLTHNDTLLGEVCHIKADQPRGARYDALQTPADRQAYDNLIILCPNHHTVIDDDEIAYTVERLLRMKSEHEASADSIPDATAERVALLYLTQEFTNRGQTGGVFAHNIHAQTINVNHSAPIDPIAQRRQLQAVETLWKAVKALPSEFGQLIYVVCRDANAMHPTGWQY